MHWVECWPSRRQRCFVGGVLSKFFEFFYRIITLRRSLRTRMCFIRCLASHLLRVCSILWTPPATFGANSLRTLKKQFVSLSTGHPKHWTPSKNWRRRIIAPSSEFILDSLTCPTLRLKTPFTSSLSSPSAREKWKSSRVLCTKQWKLPRKRSVAFIMASHVLTSKSIAVRRTSMRPLL